MQPNLYSRLLYFKYAIDKGLMRLEIDLAMFKKNSSNKIAHMSSSNTGDFQSSEYLDHRQGKDTVSSVNALKNALLVSRMTTMQTCESIRTELAQTIQNCDKALTKLNEHVASLKSQKIFKEALFYLNQHNSVVDVQASSTKLSSKSPKSSKKMQNSASATSVKKKLVSASKKQEGSASTPEIDHIAGKDSSLYELNSSNAEKSKHNEEKLFKPSSICQDFIQNRLYLNKAMMNTIEPYLEKIKLQQLLANLYEKIDLDKEILLVFTHLKREENYLNSLEPLQPLFRRYSLGFERCIQIWRKKCSADSLLLFSERINDASSFSMSDPLFLSTFNANRNNFKQELDQLYVLDCDDSTNLDRIQSSYTSSAAAACSPLMMSKFNKQFLLNKMQQEKIAESACDADIQNSSNHQRFHSGIFKYSNSFIG